MYKAPAILIVGKTGAGKSTLANNLLGHYRFHTSDSADSDTLACQDALTEINNVKYCLVDTPGIFDTRLTHQDNKSGKLGLFDSVQSDDEKMIDIIAHGLLHCIYGIKAILFVMEGGRFTKEQQNILYGTVKFLGEDSLENMIIVFSKCSKKQTEDRKYMKSCMSIDQKAFMSKIENRWTVSPNLEAYSSEDPVVVGHLTDLKNRIHKIRGVYTMEIFEKIRKARENELKELKENAGIKEARKTVENAGIKEARKTVENAGIKEARKAVEERSKEGGCFSIKSKVLLDNGNVIEVARVRIGDRVCCGVSNGKLIFSKVLAIVHADEFALTEFLKVECTKPDGSETTLRLTPEHHIFTNTEKTDFAYNLIENETKLCFINDDGDMFQVAPYRVSKDWQHGYIAPITSSGSIVVDNILCSCYATAPPYQGLLNLFITPLHLYNLVFPPEKPTREIHPYFRLLKHGQWVIEGINYFTSYLNYENK